MFDDDDRAIVGDRRLAQLVEVVGCRAQEVDAETAVTTVWALSVLGIDDGLLLNGLETATISGAGDPGTAAAGARAFACAGAALGYAADRLHEAINAALLEAMAEKHASDGVDADGAVCAAAAGASALGGLAACDVAQLVASLACASEIAVTPAGSPRRRLVHLLAGAIDHDHAEFGSTSELAACAWSFARLLDAGEHHDLFAAFARACALRRHEVASDEHDAASMAWALATRGQINEAANVLESYLDWAESRAQPETAIETYTPQSLALTESADVAKLARAFALALPNSIRARAWLRAAVEDAVLRGDFAEAELARLAHSCATLERKRPAPAAAATAADADGPLHGGGTLAASAPPAWLAMGAGDDLDDDESFSRALGSLFALLDDARASLETAALCRACWAAVALGVGGPNVDALFRALDASLVPKSPGRASAPGKGTAPLISELCDAAAALASYSSKREPNGVIIAGANVAKALEQRIGEIEPARLPEAINAAALLTCEFRTDSLRNALRTHAALDAAIACDARHAPAMLEMLAAVSTSDPADWRDGARKRRRADRNETEGSECVDEAGIDGEDSEPDAGSRAAVPGAERSGREEAGSFDGDGDDGDFLLVRLAAPRLEAREAVALLRAFATLADAGAGAHLRPAVEAVADRTATLVAVGSIRDALSLHTLSRAAAALALCRQPCLSLAAALDEALARAEATRPRRLQALHVAAARHALTRYGGAAKAHRAPFWEAQRMRPATRLLKRLVRRTQKAIRDSIDTVSEAVSEAVSESETVAETVALSAAAAGTDEDAPARPDAPQTLMFD
ncbi:hypothetical protein M885DRAFT_545301 [Pelagophyceae sp. CCMP2097]|nr:hypothetical protein M885DRAFT_545301 [Pelagophyceae sp. CCMP2097]